MADILWNLDDTLSAEDAHKIFTQAEEKVHSMPYKTLSVDDLLSEKESLGGHGRRHGRDSFDYIVIGGGTAGLILASRLAQNDPTITVCVIEAGVLRTDCLITVPGLFGKSLRKPEYDWSYKTVKQPELHDKEVLCSAGRVLGGSSGINYMIRMRASRHEYDAWSQFAPDQGWNWKGLLPSFKDQEQYVRPRWGSSQVFPGVTQEQYEAAKKEEPLYRGYKGAIWSTHNEVYTDLLVPTIKTLNSLGIRTNIKPSHGDSTGMFNIDTAINRTSGERCYSVDALKVSSEAPSPIPNLLVLTGLHVNKILFKPTTHGKPVTADGVEVRATSKHTIHFYANREVIVSTGTYSTPRILEFSGIGNPKILKKFGITTVVDLPGVGENFQDHPTIVTDYTVKEGVNTLDRLRIDPAYKSAQIDEYLTKRTGAYATVVSAYGFIKLDKFLSSAEITELKAQLDKEIAQVTNEFHKKQLAIRRKYLDNPEVGDVEIIMVPKAFATIPPADKTSYLSLLTCLPHTVSRGSTHISGADPTAPPDINPNYLTSKFDTKVLVKVTQFLRKITQSGELANIVTGPSTPPASVKTDAEIENFIRHKLITMQHPSSTASMAPRELGGVVDSNLRVYGTTNVRVADLSVIPLHIAAHTLDTVYAIGEKAFHIISGKN
ncbi:GMC oxidoreductase [Amanita thiersii Skay4041]|uniref:GMC oxidoreductase n=1 Tax=Amanita thiersii Skay4041 TaxID=703135 RepID=A0A2A9NRT0_9AGAR|nr:GMC oxidoreductase [Amanita thiersii Skay4041]